MHANVHLAQAVEAAHHLTDEAPPWDALLGSARQFLGGDSATFIAFDPRGGLVVARQHGVDAEAEREYVTHFHAHDILLGRTQGAAAGTWFDSASLPSQGLQVGERDYLDYMDRHRMRQMVGLIAISSPELQGGFTVQRSVLRPGPPDWSQQPEVRHFSAAIQAGLQRLLQQRQDWITHAQSALEGFGEAMCVLTVEGYLLHASPLATAWLGQGRGWHSRRGWLWHADAGARQRLATALQAVAQQGRPGSLALHDAAGQAWAQADLAAAPAWTGLGARAPILMRLRLRLPAVPSDDAAEFQQRVAAAFDLTPAEARVLDGLVRGQTLAAYAQQHGNSIHTVRTQVASLRHKMGCSRQVDLVRKALPYKG